MARISRLVTGSADPPRCPDGHQPIAVSECENVMSFAHPEHTVIHVFCWLWLAAASLRNLYQKARSRTGTSEVSEGRDITDPASHKASDRRLFAEAAHVIQATLHARATPMRSGSTSW